MSARMTEKEAALLETLKSALGDHPADVLGVMRAANETLWQLDALFASIKVHLERTNSPCVYAKGLAEAGVYLSQNFASDVDSQYETMRDSLLAHGIFCGGAQ